MSPPCLAVFHCHSSPCIALSTGPPSQGLPDRSAGNSRLSCCVCSIGADGSVAVINLSERRTILVTGSGSKVSASSVVALGWRVLEDLLLVARSDDSLEVWDISAGCLDRFETDQIARDLFEQSQYIVEVQNNVSSFTLSIPLLSNQTSGSHARPSQPPAVYGSVNHPSSAASVAYTSRTRVRRRPRDFHVPTRRLHQTTVFQIHAVGSTKHSSIADSEQFLDRGPAALVFQWDLESLIVDLLAESEQHNSSNGELTDNVQSQVVFSTKRSLIQLLLSITHPWGVDQTADCALRTCCGYPSSGSNSTYSPQLQQWICLGFLSKHGCLSLSMPGWPAHSSLDLPSVSARLYCLSRTICTNLLLSELAVVEAISRFRDHEIAKLFDFPACFRTSSLESDVRSPLLSAWLNLGQRICGSTLVKSLMTDRLTSNTCSPELESLAQKWQDRSLPIRYSARTLLLALLDNLDHETRGCIVNYWSSLLPSFSRTHFMKSSTDQNPSTPQRSLITNGSASSQDQTTMTRKPSLQHPVATGQQIRRFSSVESDNVQLSDVCGLLGTAESVSLQSLDDSISTPHQPLAVSSSHWWYALGGYRVSAREHSRLQAIAIVLLGVIGSRFGSSSDPRSAPVAARDLIEQAAPDGSTHRSVGLATGSFDPPDHGTITSPSPAFDRIAEPFQPGFGGDNYHLAYSVSHCLTTLLFGKVTSTEETDPDKATTHSESRGPDQPAYGLDNRVNDVLSAIRANSLAHLLTTNVSNSLRRTAIDLLGRGFLIWEPHIDLAQVVNSLLILAVDAKRMLADLPTWKPLADRVDLARTAREALWQIAFARPKTIILLLSVEVRRHGGQLTNAALTSVPQYPIATSAAVRTTTASGGTYESPPQVDRRDSSTAANVQPPTQSSKMVVMMTSPAFAAPVFVPSGVGQRSASVPRSATPSSPLFASREEVVQLFEQLCVRRPVDVIPVLTELVEVVLACSDRTRLKERGFDVVFPCLTKFTTFSTNTRSQKACVGSFAGSLTFFDFKLGRYCVTSAHKGPVTAIRFNEDGRLIASYSSTDGTLRIWQLHAGGLFGMGGQQVKAVSTHPVPPLVPPPSTHQAGSDRQADALVPADLDQHVCPEQPAVWLIWSEPHAIHLSSHGGLKRRITVS